MWAITSSSPMCAIGETRATAIISRPPAKQSWRQSGTGRPFSARVDRALRVERGREQQRQQLQRGEGAADVGDGGSRSS